ncbi:MAG: HAD family hydrolase [Turicibacter sp.]|nr:HAD family hydrolase [Turicibacter sp.]
MKLFGSDYDGTFYKHENRGENELAENIAAVEKWREAGHLFAFATGRSIGEMAYDRIINHITFDYLVGLNGGIIINHKDEVMFRALIEPSVASEIVDLIQARNFGRLSVTDGFKGHYPIALFEGEYAESLAQYPEIVANFSLTLEEALANPVAMIALSTANTEEAVAFATLVNETFAGQVTAFANLQHVDIAAAGTSKATGLEYVAKRYSIDKNNVFGMGDSYNDVPMLENFNGFTLPEANDEIKSFADNVYETVAAAIKDVI